MLPRLAISRTFGRADGLLLIFIQIIILSLWLLIPSVSISGRFLRARSAKTDSLLLLKTDWPTSFV
ncbi:Uncharacterised protein [Segatella copri]|nr:Uncharacterised protein [Segatella copri]